MIGEAEDDVVASGDLPAGGERRYLASEMRGENEGASPHSFLLPVKTRDKLVRLIP